jgi:hypothetical protein
VRRPRPDPALPESDRPGAAALATLGPFFAVEVHDPAVPPAGSWRPLRELTEGGAALAERIEAVRAYLAAGTAQPVEAVEARVAASVTHLGLAARLLSPGFGSLLLTGRPLELAGACWRPAPGGPLPLSVPAAGFSAAGAGPPAPALFGGPLHDLGEAVPAWSVSERIVRGNVASALFGAVAAVAVTRPDLAGPARRLAAELLEQSLPGAGTLTPGGYFRRRSCCLIYRAAPGRDGPRCGDCVLTR